MFFGKSDELRADDCFYVVAAQRLNGLELLVHDLAQLLPGQMLRGVFGLAHARQISQVRVGVVVVRVQNVALVAQPRFCFVAELAWHEDIGVFKLLELFYFLDVSVEFLLGAKDLLGDDFSRILGIGGVLVDFALAKARVFCLFEQFSVFSNVTMSAHYNSRC